MRSKIVVMTVVTLAVLGFSSGDVRNADAQLTVTAPTHVVADVFLTHVGEDKENACVLQLKVDTESTEADMWRLFRLNEADDHAALVFCMSRLVGDCVATMGETTTEIAVGGYIVDAQDITGYSLENITECVH